MSYTVLRFQIKKKIGWLNFFNVRLETFSLDLTETSPLSVKGCVISLSREGTSTSRGDRVFFFFFLGGGSLPKDSQNTQ